ncbi:ParA family partition ATPase [Facilibium subflavum]|uniref:ParA family partition ATPase n=1 Tax=Facilibium subflavum TaxID=2219058 RepID=UPI000E64ECE7|nr:ParA family partition ATPase [Facilibium subflavum]
MKIVSILNQKGGSGKTTLSTNIAHALKLKGYKVLLVDGDPQGSCRDWNAANDGNIVPVVGLDRETLPKDLDAIKNGYDWIIIDGAPQIARLAASAIKASDIVLIPVQPSPYDIWATSDLVDLIKARQEITDNKLNAAFVISRSIKNTRLSHEINEALNEYELPVLKNGTTQKVAYPTSATEGGTVFTIQDQKASHEINMIVKELMEL